MNVLNTITKEYIRRFSILILLALFAWMFFYAPSDIYEIKVEDYATKYHDKVKNGDIDISETSLDDYIAYKMKGPYTWSSRERKIVEVEGESGKFLNQIFSVNKNESSDAFINEHRSPNTFWRGNSYFFRSADLPNNFLSNTFLKHPDYLITKGENGQKSYFKIYKVERTFTRNNAPNSVGLPLRIYSYLLLVVSLLIYLMIPKPKVPQGAAHYTKFNAVYLPDALGVFLWTGAWMFFFLPDDSAPMFVRYFFLSFFAIFALAIILPTVKYASNWYLFTEDSFQWSGVDGIGKVSLDEIVSIKPYKRQLPKWVAPLIILFGKGQPGPTGIGTITATSSPEIGMEITTNDSRKVKVMANYLEADEVFTERFQVLEKNLQDKIKE